MRPQELKPIWRWKHLSFRLRSKLPDAPGLYVICVFNQVYYIGLASSLRNRWKGKKHHRFHVARLVPFSCLRYIEVPEPDLRDCENYLIKKIDPPWNYTPDPIDGYLGALLWHLRGHNHSERPPIDWVEVGLWVAIAGMGLFAVKRLLGG
ncbi:MAG: hypothetical protein AAGF93_00505 [Cyanobacteria bacterium P01_H01_bin.105]